MGRSRITRTYHNKPVSRQSNKPQPKVGSNTRITATKAAKMAQEFKKTKTTKPTTTRSVSKTTKQKASSTQAKFKSKGLIPQAHAQEASEQQTKSKKEPLEGKDLEYHNVHTQIISRHTQNQGSHNYHGFTPLHGDGPHNANWSLGSDDLKGISGRTKRINEQRVDSYLKKQQGSHLEEKRGFNPPFATGKDGRPTGGTDAGVIETIKRSKTGYNVFGHGEFMNMDADDLSTYGGITGRRPKSPIKIKERTILGKFAQGVGNEAYDIAGVPYGLVTGQDYKTKSILSRATEHAFAGDWDSAGKVISDNPYRFAGNVATNIGLSVIPFGMITRGAGLAGKGAGLVSRGVGATGIAGKTVGKVVGKLKTKGALGFGKGGIRGKGATVPGNKVRKKEWIRREKAADADLLRSDIRAGLRDSPGTVIPGRGVIGKDGLTIVNPSALSRSVTNAKYGVKLKVAKKLIPVRRKVSKLKSNYKYANPDKKTFEGKVGRAKMLPQKIRDKKGDIDLKIKKKTYYKGFTQLHGRRRESINNPDYWGGPYSSRAGSLRAADRDIWEVNRFNKGRYNFRQQKPKSGVAFIPTTVPKHVGIGYDEYY
jgi:hypothetical protein